MQLQRRHWPISLDMMARFFLNFSGADARLDKGFDRARIQGNLMEFAQQNVYKSTSTPVTGLYIKHLHHINQSPSFSNNPQGRKLEKPHISHHMATYGGFLK